MIFLCDRLFAFLGRQAQKRTDGQQTKLAVMAECLSDVTDSMEPKVSNAYERTYNTSTVPWYSSSRLRFSDLSELLISAVWCFFLCISLAEIPHARYQVISDDVS